MWRRMNSNEYMVWYVTGKLAIYRGTIVELVSVLYHFLYKSIYDATVSRYIFNDTKQLILLTMLVCHLLNPFDTSQLTHLIICQVLHTFWYIISKSYSS